MLGIKMDVKFQKLLEIYENEIAKKVKNKNALFNFELNKMQNLENIMAMLTRGNVGHERYNIFLIYEPKCRLVMSLSIRDKIINHYLTREILEPRLSKYLDDRNCATRKDMGNDYAIKLVIKYLKRHRFEKEFYILKMDISKYFYNIDHNVLLGLLKDKLNSVEYSLIKRVIDSTNKQYINECIGYLRRKYGVDIPYYDYNKGLPIGSMTSQILSIFYLSDLDHYIVHDLHLKEYVRYMDDFVIFCTDKEKIKRAKDLLSGALWERYKLRVNLSKTQITKSDQGFSFLGFRYRVVNNKVIVKMLGSKIKKIKNRIKNVRYNLDRGLIDYNKAFSSIMSYSSNRYTSNELVSDIVERYFFYEK